MHPPSLVADTAMVLGVAAVTSVLARRLGQPSILGYLLAGLIVGPYLPVPIFADPGRVEAMAEFGVVLVMFTVGLELRVTQLLRVLPVSGLTAAIQIGLLIWCGYTLGIVLGWSSVEAAFLGGSIGISSTMVVAGIFAEQPPEEDLREHVVGILVLQDVVAIGLIAVLTAVAAGGGLGARELLGTVGRLAGVLGGLVVVGLFLVPRLVRYVGNLGSSEILVVVSVGLCFVLALVADSLGYSVALGSFIAGMVVAESGRGHDVERVSQPLRDVFAAIFFVSIGMTVDPLQALQNLPTSMLVLVVVVVAQLVSITLGTVLSGAGLRRGLTAGLALGQIGEFAFIIAAIGISAGVVRPALQPILVTVAVMSTFSTSLLLRRAQALVHLVDHRLPPRVRRALTMYESLIDRSKRAPGGNSQGARRAFRVAVLDGLLIVGLVAASRALTPVGVDWLSDRLGLSATAAELVVLGALVMAVAPLAVGMVRATSVIARRLADAMLPEEAAAGPLARATSRMVRVMLRLAVAFGFGLPTLALLRPFLSGPYAMPLLLVIAAVTLIQLWRTAGALEVELRSGAQRLLDALSTQPAERDDDPTLVDALDVPDLEVATRCRLLPESPAVGRTLAELDLRARTGATVIAIHHHTGDVVFPTGHEKLAEGDWLALVGAESAIDRAATLMLGGAWRSLTDLTPVARESAAEPNG